MIFRRPGERAEDLVVTQIDDEPLYFDEVPKACGRYQVEVMDARHGVPFVKKPQVRAEIEPLVGEIELIQGIEAVADVQLGRKAYLIG